MLNFGCWWSLLWDVLWRDWFSQTKTSLRPLYRGSPLSVVVLLLYLFSTHSFKNKQMPNSTCLQGPGVSPEQNVSYRERRYRPSCYSTVIISGRKTAAIVVHPRFWTWTSIICEWIDLEIAIDLHAVAEDEVRKNAVGPHAEKELPYVPVSCWLHASVSCGRHPLNLYPSQSHKRQSSTYTIASVLQ